MTRTEIAVLFEEIADLWNGKFRLDNAARTMNTWYNFFASVPAPVLHQALRAYASKGSGFPPTAPELMAGVETIMAKEYMSPDELVAKVRRAVNEYGPFDTAGAKTFLGEAWKTVTETSSWQRTCQHIDEAKLKTAWEARVKELIRERK